MEPKLIPFDITKLKTHEVVTRDRKKVLEIYYCKAEFLLAPIISVIEGEDRQVSHKLNGFYRHDGIETEFDLFLISKTKKLWANCVKRTDGSYYITDGYPSLAALESCEECGDRKGIFSFELEE